MLLLAVLCAMIVVGLSVLFEACFVLFCVLCAVVNCCVLIDGCPLSVSCCGSHVCLFYRLLTVVCCLACACRSLFVVCCLLFVVRGTWFVVGCCSLLVAY